MRDQHISLTRNVSLTESDERLYDYLLANLPPSCSVWPGLRISQTADRRQSEIDLIVLGHYSLYVVEHKGPSSVRDPGFIHDAHDQVQRYAHILAAAIDGDPPGPRPWLEPVVVLSPDPPDARPSLPFLLGPAELVRAAVSGELPGHPGPPPRAPLDADTIDAIRRTLDNPGPHASRRHRQAEVARLKQRLVVRADATPLAPADELAVSSWLITTCFLLLAEARGWTPPRTTLGVHETLVAMAELPCVRAIFPADIPALPETALRTLYASLQPLVCQVLDDWHSTAAAWSDLYESLPSAEQRGTYATLPTPTFISDFLCRHTVDPAIAVFGTGNVHVLDPACGPGTMLCAAFHRLADADDDAALHALGRVHGIDIDPIAALIARFRLLTAYLERADASKLADLPALPIYVITADALLTAPPRLYHAVVCNPPYTTPKDAATTQQYRQRFPNSARGKFSLTAPFVERCFQLAEPGGFVGLIASNSFTRRAFGERLVEAALAKLDISSIIDTSGAYIPGHGTPTLLLFGRNRPPASELITVVTSKSGEPSPPADPARGFVWQTIAQHHADIGYEDDQIAVHSAPRARLLRHPMDLSHGPTQTILDALAAASSDSLGSLTRSIGGGARSGADPVFIHSPDALARMGIEPHFTRPYIQGDSFTPWAVHPTLRALALESAGTDESLLTKSAAWRFLWRYRTLLEQRLSPFGRPTAWWHWSRWNGGVEGMSPAILVPSIARTPLFVPAPVDTVASGTLLRIELEPLDEPSSQAVVAYLNSSTARFWLGHHCYRRNEFLELSASIVARLPLPDALISPGPVRDALAALARRLRDAAQALVACSPEATLGRWHGGPRPSLLEFLAEAQANERKLLRRIVHAQEDLDWTIYRLIGLSDDPGSSPEGSALPEHRPFAWRGSKPPNALDDRLVVAWTRRSAAIAALSALRLVESSPYKTSFGQSVKPEPEPESASSTLGRTHLVTPNVRYRQRIIAAALTEIRRSIESTFAEQATPHALSVAAITATLARAAPTRAVLSLLSPNKSPDDSTRVLSRLLADNAAPYLSSLRYSRSGLVKRAVWEQNWHSSDNGSPIPPQYTAKDYRTALIWQHRGKYDVESEPFIAYPRAAPDGDTLYGWTGWGTDTRAAVLWSIYTNRRDSGGSRDILAALLAGLHDLTVECYSVTNADHLNAAITGEAIRLGIPTDVIHPLRTSEADPTTH